MKEPFLINPMGVNPREKTVIPKKLFSLPGVGSFLKELSKSKPGSKKAFKLRSLLRRKGFKLSDKKTWGKSFVAKLKKKSKKSSDKKHQEFSTKKSKVESKRPEKKMKHKAKRKVHASTSEKVPNPFRHNPLLIAGLNPFKKKGGVKCMAKKKRHNPPKKSHKRKFRRNPAGGFLSGSVLSNPKSLITPIAVGVGAKIVTDRVPGFVGTTDPLTKSGVQVGIAVGGSLLVGRFLSKEAALMWLVVSMTTALSNLANHFVLDNVLGPVLGAYPPYSNVGRFLPRVVSEERLLPEPRSLSGSMSGDPVGYPFSNEV